MRTEQRQALAVALFAGALLTAGCKSREASCNPKADDSVVACVDGVPVPRATAAQYVEEPWWTPGSAELPDARAVAVDKAIRTQLFAAQARRDGLKLPPGQPDVAASWSQAYVAHELAKLGVSRDAITDEQASKYYAANLEMFNQIDRVEVQVIAFSEPAKALAVYPRAATADEAGFRALAEAHSIDDKTRAKGGDRTLIASTDEDHELLKMALTLAKVGALGGPFKASDGKWYLLRIKAPPVEHGKPYDEVMKHLVKNALVDQRRRALIAELDARLRKNAAIQIIDTAVKKLPPPVAR